MNIQAKIRAFFANLRHRKAIFALLKLLVPALLAGAVYHQVFQREDLAGILAGFSKHLRSENLGWIALAIVLMPLNWGLEAQKWRLLLRPSLELSFRRAAASILAGISVSLFTPNRIGEYGGRLFGLPGGYAWLGLAATFVGSMAQWIVLWCAGLWGLAVCGASMWPFWASFYDTYGWALWGGALLFPILYIHLGHVQTWLKEPGRLHTDKWQRWMKLPAGLHSYKRETLMQALSLAAGRYLVFSSQYLFLLYGFGVALHPAVGMAGIALLFLVQSGLPLPPFMALVARGELAVLLWSGYGANELAVLAATFALFIINLLIPALLGGAAIVKIK